MFYPQQTLMSSGTERNARWIQLLSHFIVLENELRSAVQQLNPAYIPELLKLRVWSKSLNVRYTDHQKVKKCNYAFNFRCGVQKY